MTATTWLLSAMEVMWRSALIVLPPALVVAGICRFVSCRPATRHLLWFVILVLPAGLPLLTQLRPPAATPSPAVTPPCTPSEPEPPADESLPLASDADQPAEQDFAATADEPQPAAEPADEKRCGERVTCRSLRTERELTDVRAGSLRPLVLARGLGPAERPSQSGIIECARPAAVQASDQAFSAFPVMEPLDMPVVTPPLAARLADAMQALRSAFSSGLQKAGEIADSGLVWMQRLMPPAPIRVWLAGGGLLLALHIANKLRFRRLLGRSRPAGEDLTGMVDKAAAALGLRRIPAVRLSDDRISPMVGGVFAPRLIFPAELWSQLDQSGRRAILVHELAHLYRRDHWVRAIEAAITAVFWWHPAAWWARRRVREEAEVCCDAWVTWLLPQGRRAYATALLKTQAFVGNSAAPGSGAGIGVVSVRAKRFARRLTMVMSESGKPRLSPLGLVLASVPLLLAWAAVPVLSCPPQETPEPSAPAAWTPSADSTPCPESTPAPTAMGGSYRSYLQTATPQPLPQLVSNLYSQLVGTTFGTMQQPRPRSGGDRDDLEARLERLERQLDRLSRQMEELGVARTPAPPMAVARRARPAIAAAPGGDGPVVGKVYRLSGGKLEPLTKLMIREDVPIKVRPTDDGIEIFATPGQHEALAGFIAIIDPAQGGGVFLAPRARAGMPVPMVAPGPGPGPGPGAAGGAWVMPNMKAQAKATKAAAKALEAQRRALEKQAEKLREQSEKLKERADELKSNERSDSGAQIKEMLAKAEAADREAEAREEKLAAIESQLDAVSDAAEALETSVGHDKDDDNDNGEDVTADLRAKAESDEKDGSTWFKLGFSLHTEGRYDEAREAFQKAAELDFNRMQSIYNIGCGYARAGDADQAIAYLQKAWDAGFTDVDHYKNDEDLKSLQNDARFKSMLDSKHDAP